jgi:uncharacterized protein YciI
MEEDMRKFLLGFVLLLACSSSFMLPAQNVPSTPSHRPQFFVKLIPPRPTFATDMTPDEQHLMQEHAKYWSEQFAKGGVLLAGPVFDPKGAFGIIVMEADAEDQVRAVAMEDPTVKAGLNKIEVSPMNVFVMKGK